LAEARFSHPHIVNIYDYGEWTDGRPFVVMELIEGQTLQAALAGGRNMSWRRAVIMGAEIASALAAVHARGIVHRDVSSGNVMLTPNGARLVDFGICALAGEPQQPLREGELLGTPAYIAPERLRGGKVGPAADVYALGVLLYRALSGRLPWPAESPPDLLHAHLWVNPVPLPAIAGLPERASRLCMRCLAKDPAERPSSAEIAIAFARIARIPAIVPPFATVPPGEHVESVGRLTTALPLPPDEPEPQITLREKATETVRTVTRRRPPKSGLALGGAAFAILGLVALAAPAKPQAAVWHPADPAPVVAPAAPAPPALPVAALVTAGDGKGGKHKKSG